MSFSENFIGVLINTIIIIIIILLLLLLSSAFNAQGYQRLTTSCPGGSPFAIKYIYFNNGVYLRVEETGYREDNNLLSYLRTAIFKFFVHYKECKDFI